MKRFVLSTLILMAFQASSLAQSSFSIQANTFFPTGEMRRDLPYDWGGGFSLEYVQKITTSIYAGVRYSSTLNNRNQQMWALPEPLGTRNVIWDFQMNSFYWFARFKPNMKGPIRPYLDLAVGNTWIKSEARYILTEAEGAMVHDEEECPDNSVTLNRMKDKASAFGLGGGFEVILNPDLMLDFNITSHRGDQVEVLTPVVNEYTERTHINDLSYRTGLLEYMSINFTIRMSLTALFRDNQENTK